MMCSGSSSTRSEPSPASTGLSEVRAVLIVGRNIAGQTRVLTTAIVLETSEAHYLEASILGVILFVVAFVVFAVLQRLQSEGIV